MPAEVYTAQSINIFREKFFSLIQASNNIVITAHISPDDDSIASVLSMYSILTQKYPEKKIQMIYTGQSVDRYSIFYNFEKIQFVDDIASYLKDIDLLVFLDCNNIKRSSRFPEKFSDIKNLICIDHHSSLPDEFSLALIDSSYSSNSELIYDTLEAENYLDKNLSEIFLLGILGDTGNLTHINKGQSKVFSIVKKLVEVGDIRIDSFLSKFKFIPKKIIPLLQEYVKNTNFLEIENWPSLQYSFVDRKFIYEYGFSDEDMSAASHIYLSQYLPRIQNQSWGFVFSPRSDGGVRMSSRSNADSVNVRIFHEKMGIGGGHDRASGANFIKEDGDIMSIDECLNFVLEFMKNNKPVLS